MHRIDSETATDDNLFSEGDPGIGQLPTTFTPAWCNAIQEELAAIVENEDGGNTALVKENNGQVLDAIRSMITGAVSSLSDAFDAFSTATNATVSDFMTATNTAIADLTTATNAAIDDLTTDINASFASFTTTVNDALDAMTASLADWARKDEFVVTTGAGWVKRVYPDGWTEMWVRGSTDGTGTEATQTINFPSAFATACVDVQVTTEITSGSGSADVTYQRVGAPSTSTVTVIRQVMSDDDDRTTTPCIHAVGY